MFFNFITFHDNTFYPHIVAYKKKKNKKESIFQKKKYKKGKKDVEGKESKGRDDIEDQDSGRIAC